MTFTNRLHFAAVVRDAIRRGTLVNYERDLRLGRTATLTDGRVLTYEPAWQSMLRQEQGR